MSGESTVNQLMTNLENNDRQTAQKTIEQARNELTTTDFRNTMQQVGRQINDSKLSGNGFNNVRVDADGSISFYQQETFGPINRGVSETRLYTASQTQTTDTRSTSRPTTDSAGPTEIAIRHIQGATNPIEGAAGLAEFVISLPRNIFHANDKLGEIFNRK